MRDGARQRSSVYLRTLNYVNMKAKHIFYRVGWDWTWRGVPFFYTNQFIYKVMKTDKKGIIKK